MSLIFIPNTAPSYAALSTDVSGSKIAGASYIGAYVYLIDTGKTYIVTSDLTLEEVASTGGGSSASAVSVDNFPVTYPVSGSLLAEISNLPTHYPVSGSLVAEVSNFPIEYPVSGSIVLQDGTASIGSVIIEEMPYGGYAYGSDFVSGFTSGSIGDATPTEIIASAGSALSIHLTSLMVTNSGATGTNVGIISGSAGDVMWRGYAVGEGGGFAITFPVPLRFTQGTGVFIGCQETSGINVIASAAGYKA